MGGLAALQVGPVARNLSGARAPFGYSYWRWVSLPDAVGEIICNRKTVAY